MMPLQSQFAVLLVATSLFVSLPLVAQESQDGEIQQAEKTALAALGTYTGMFDQHKITVSIEKVVGRSLLGYSIVMGNERAFSGAWQTVENGIAFVGKEPGDHPQDGIFTLIFNAKDKTLNGTWEATNQKVAAVKLQLKAQKFKYNPKVGEYPEASTRLLKESDVENLRQSELRLMRNEIYARHGYSFTIKDMQEHFAKVDWYMPVALDVAGKLTPTEVKNAALIRRYETYGAEYYDRFGR